MCKDQLLALLSIPVTLAVIKRFALARRYRLGIGQESILSSFFRLYQNLTDYGLVELEEG